MKSLNKAQNSSGWEQPPWAAMVDLPIHKLPASIQPYFCRADSTTKQIQAAGHRLVVRTHLAYWTVVRGEERYRLDLKTSAWMPPLAWVREVMLSFDKTLFMFARSVFSFACMQEKGDILKQLGHQSLGTVLFSDPSLRRSAFRWARVRQHHRLYQHLNAHLMRLGERDVNENTPWARQSSFVWQGHSVVLTEVFLS